MHLLSPCPQPSAREWEELAHAPASHGEADGCGAGWPSHLIADNPSTWVKKRWQFSGIIYVLPALSATFGVSMYLHIQIVFQTFKIFHFYKDERKNPIPLLR